MHGHTKFVYYLNDIVIWHEAMYKQNKCLKNHLRKLFKDSPF